MPAPLCTIIVVVHALIAVCAAVDSRVCPGGTNYVNPPESDRRYSGTLNHNGADSRLDSKYAWCMLAFADEQWMTLDLSYAQTVLGVVVQGRHNHAPHYIQTFELQYSDDGVTYLYSGTYTAVDIAPRDAKHEIVLTSPVYARYLKIYMLTWHQYGCMRIAAIVSCDAPCATNSYLLKVASTANLARACGAQENAACPVDASSYHNDNTYRPSNINDDEFGHTFAHTSNFVDSSESHPNYYVIDFQQQRSDVRVDLYVNWHMHWTNKGTIHLGDSPEWSSNAVCVHPLNADSYQLHLCSGTGQYMFIIGPVVQPVRQNPFSITEVQVFYPNKCTACPPYTAAPIASMSRAACTALPRPPFGFVQRCAVPAPSTMTATVCAAMTAGTNVTLHAAAARGTTQLLRYSFAETWGCTAQVNVSATERISAPLPHQVLPCAPRPGAVFVRAVAPCHFECDENHTRAGDACARVCGNATTAHCEPGHYAADVCAHAGYTLYRCEPCSYADGRQLRPWSGASAVAVAACPSAPCAAGSHGADGACALCDANTFSAVGSAACEACPPGSFAPPASVACAQCFDPPSAAGCAPGLEAARSVAAVDAYFAWALHAGHNVSQHRDLYVFCHARVACLPCMPGHAEQGGACVACDYAQYQPLFQTSRCFQCSRGHNTSARGSASAADCLCHAGFE